MFSRPGCPLCDDAREVLVAAGLAFDEVDISRDPGLTGEYGTRVPVVEAGGEVVFEAGMNPRDLPILIS
jgi:glutaredoxin